MCFDLTPPIYLQVSRDLLFVTIFPPDLWQVGPILLGCGIPHLGWSSFIYWRDLPFHELYSPHITYTQTYSHTHVFAPPNLLVRCHRSLMALFLIASSAYVQHRFGEHPQPPFLRRPVPYGPFPFSPVEADLRELDVWYMPVTGGYSPLL